MSEQQTITIVGVGLIGGSIGAAVKKRRMFARVIGVGRRQSSLDRAMNCGVVDETTLDLREAAARSDLLVLCSPVEIIARQAAQAVAVMPERSIVTDAGSVKGAIAREFGDWRLEAGERKSEVGSRKAPKPIPNPNSQIPNPKSKQVSPSANRFPPSPTFLPAHPLAGSEKTGPEHADADLFEGRVTILTPLPDSPAWAVTRTREFWEGLGSRVFEMTPDEHDAAVAAISHAPHVVASALAAATPAERTELAGRGWLDTTRVAGGDVELWRQILTANRAHTLSALAAFAKTLDQLHAALEHEDDAALTRLLAEGKDRRDAVGSGHLPGGE